jgi:hypothetical protein
VETFASLAALPADAALLFAVSSTFFSARAWWEIVLTHAIQAGAEPCLVLIRVNDEAVALFPMLAGDDFRALTTPYTCLYEPLIVSEREAAFTAFTRYCRSFSKVRLDALDETAEAEIAAAARRAGLAVARFDHFGNWYEDVSGLDWVGYLARRPGALRETIRRRTRRAERLTDASFRLFDGPDDLETGIAAFETVYARSWKDPEPFPGINPAQIRAAAGLGIARLGVWWIGGAPAAVQFWIMEHGQATVLKLAHDEAFKTHSPGTVVTAWMIRYMLEREHAVTLDFGRGDDPYKQDWVSSRRQRIGLMLINPRRLGGMIALVRHAMGRVRARLRPNA